VLAAKECVAGIMSSSACQFTDTEHHRVVQLRKEMAVASTAIDFVCRDNVEGIYHLFISLCQTICSGILMVFATSGAGNGMAGMASAIPILNLVWRRHTNLLKFGQLIFTKIIRIVPPDVRFQSENAPKSILLRPRPG